MGLDYLNKKVWHPGSMKNIQKVWDAQQAQLQVIKKQKERAKKLLDEQYNEEMKRIQVEAGLIPRSHLDRMDWLYDGGNKLQQQKNNEDYLTGQKKANSKESKHIFQQQPTNRRCQDFILLHQDPMFAIQKQQAKARQNIMNNPIEMRNIIHEVEENYIKLNPDKNKEKKHKKDKHRKHKKDKKDRKQSRSDREDQSRKSKRRSVSSSSSSKSSSSSRSRSRDKQSKNSSKSSKSSKLYEEYLKNTFGSILKKDESGNLVPDYGMHKKKYRTQMQLNEDERRQKIQKMRQNAKLIRQRSYSRSPSPQEKHGDYERGLANIRQKSFESQVKHKREREDRY